MSKELHPAPQELGPRAEEMIEYVQMVMPQERDTAIGYLMGLFNGKGQMNDSVGIVFPELKRKYLAAASGGAKLPEDWHDANPEESAEEAKAAVKVAKKRATRKKKDA